MSRYGIGYVIIAIGARDDPCQPEDLAAVLALMEERLPFKAVALHADTADAVTAALVAHMPPRTATA